MCSKQSVEGVVGSTVEFDLKRKEDILKFIDDVKAFDENNNN